MLKSKNFTKSDEYEILRKLSFNASSPDSALYFARKYLELAPNDYHKGIAQYHMGNGFRLKGNYSAAIEYYLKSLKNSKRGSNSKDIATSLISLGDVYSLINNHDLAVDYYRQAIQMLKGAEMYKLLASAQLNLGDEYFNVGELDSALLYFDRAGAIYKKINYQAGIAYNLGNVGLVYAEKGEASLAEANIQSAVEILEEMADFYGVSVYLTYMAGIYANKRDYSNAIKYGEESLRLAEAYGLKEQIRDASLELSQLYEQQGNIAAAYSHHKQYVVYRDSINNSETIQKIANLRTEYEVGQKQVEVDLLTSQKKNQRLVMIGIAVFALILLILSAIIYKYYQSKSRINKILEAQKQQLEVLNETKDKFFSIISHDLRGPVSSFMGIGRMIKHYVSTKETDQLLEVADDIDHSVERLSSLLDNLLSWAKQQRGHFPNVPEKINLSVMLNELIDTMGNMASSKNIRLMARTDQYIELWADHNTTMTIFRNLVNNALKFTQEGGVVTVYANAIGDFAEIRITDTGVGIPQDKLRSLFGLQARKSTYGTSGEKGLGLGLQLVYEFIEMNQGSIDVESEEGKGTTFIIRLPLFEKMEVEV